MDSKVDSLSWYVPWNVVSKSTHFCNAEYSLMPWKKCYLCTNYPQLWCIGFNSERGKVLNNFIDFPYDLGIII